MDRGYHGVETFTLLMLLKNAYPERVFLLRGNHESRIVTEMYGFKEEVILKYKSKIVYLSTCELFNALPLAAVHESPAKF